MSIGLNDLKKTKRKSTSSETSGAPVAGANREATQPSRPWNNSPLKNAAASARRAHRSEAAMSEEWSSLHAAPLFWIDLPADSKLMQIQEKLARIEERVQAVVMERWASLNRFLKPRT